MPDQETEVVELVAAVGAEADVAVEGRLHGRCLDRAGRADDRCVAAQCAHELGVAVGGDGHHFTDREVDDLAVTGALGAQRGGGHRHARERARQPFAGAATRLEGHLMDRTAPHQPARLRLHDELAHRPVGVGPGQSVRRDRAHHQPGIRLVERASVDARRQTVDDDVGRRHQLDDLRVLRAADHRPHAVVQEPEERAALDGVDRRASRRPGTPRVAVGRLHLHHVGAGVGEQPAAVRARDAATEVDDAKRAQPLLHCPQRIEDRSPTSCVPATRRR
jgi:hypothetical protein